MENCQVSDLALHRRSLESLCSMDVGYTSRQREMPGNNATQRSMLPQGIASFMSLRSSTPPPPSLGNCSSPMSVSGSSAVMYALYDVNTSSRQLRGLFNKVDVGAFARPRPYASALRCMASSGHWPPPIIHRTSRRTREPKRRRLPPLVKAEVPMRCPILVSVLLLNVVAALWSELSAEQHLCSGFSGFLEDSNSSVACRSVAAGGFESASSLRELYGIGAWHVISLDFVRLHLRLVSHG